MPYSFRLPTLENWYLHFHKNPVSPDGWRSKKEDHPRSHFLGQIEFRLHARPTVLFKIPNNSPARETDRPEMQGAIQRNPWRLARVIDGTLIPGGNALLPSGEAHEAEGITESGVRRVHKRADQLSAKELKGKWIDLLTKLHAKLDDTTRTSTGERRFNAAVARAKIWQLREQACAANGADRESVLHAIAKGRRELIALGLVKPSTAPLVPPLQGRSGPQ